MARLRRALREPKDIGGDNPALGAVPALSPRLEAPVRDPPSPPIEPVPQAPLTEEEQERCPRATNQHPPKHWPGSRPRTCPDDGQTRAVEHEMGRPSPGGIGRRRRLKSQINACSAPAERPLIGR